MKSFSIFFSLLILLLCLSLVAQDVDLEAEKEAIKKVLYDAERAYFDMDSLLQISCYTTGDILAVGYNIGGGPFNKYGQQNPVRNANPPITDENRTHSVEHKDYKILVDGDLAWATFMQDLKIKTTGGDIVKTRRQNRTLIKENNQWKIVNNTWIEINQKPIESKYFDLLEQVMYFCLWDKEYEKGLQVAKLRHQWVPNSAHSFFDIGYFYEKIGNTEEAKNYFTQARNAMETDQSLPIHLKGMLERMLAARLDNKK